MAKHDVLLVEDEPDLAHLIKHTLERGAGAEVRIVVAGDLALKAAAAKRADLVILDLNLPVVGGLEVCRILRSRPETRSVPIMMLTARATEDDRIHGLEQGADDYVTKPFSLRELTARVRAILRRSDVNHSHADAYRGERLTADFDAVSFSVDGAAVRLTRKEFELLRYLVQNKNRVVSRDRLLEHVWGYDQSVETRSVDVHVSRLRIKLASAGRQLETVIGLGYRFID